MLSRPGVHTSEFAVALLTLIGSIVSAAQSYISSGSAVRYSIAGAVAYIVSRGLAKVEARTSSAAAPAGQAGGTTAP